MKTQEAKKIPIVDVLSRLGLQPVKKFKGGIELGFISPFRGEKEPSFFVNIEKNVWYDFAEKGGNLLDFVIRYKNTDVRGALKFLDDLFGSLNYLPIIKRPEKPIEKPESEPIFKLDKVKPFDQNSLLAEYILNKRKIGLEVGKKYLSEVYFINIESRKKYFAVGFENISGGYEIRNPYFKSSIGQKDISVIRGRNSMSLLIFEGFMDFLSYLTINNKLELDEEIIVLNTLSYCEKALEIIKAKTYTEVKGFLDNDNSGNEKTLFFQDELKSIFNDQRKVFSPHKDINAFLQTITI